jgi:hypothetical protein
MADRRNLAFACGLVWVLVVAACGAELPSTSDDGGRDDVLGDSHPDEADTPDVDVVTDDAAGPDTDDAEVSDADDGAETTAPGFTERSRTTIGSGFHPRLQADASGRLHLVYHDGNQVFYRSWSGAWTAAELVPGSDGVSRNKATRHRMWVNPAGDRVDVSWGTGWGNDIRFARRDGTGWHGPETACSASVRPWEYAAVAGRSTGDDYVFCMVDDLWVAHRSPAGVWDAPLNIWTGASKHVAAVTTPDDEIHAAFRFARVRYVRGDGSTWSDVYDVTGGGDSAELPAIVVDGSGTVHLAWQRWLGSGTVWAIDSVRYARGNDATWSGGGPGVLVHAYAAPANPPELAVDGLGRVLVAWVEGSAVLLSASVDGATFAGPFPAATDPAPVDAGALENDLATPPLVVLGSDVHLVYENDAGQLVHLVGGLTL